MKEDFILVIPARLDSTRLSKKLLINIEGKSMIERTYNQALKALKDKDKIIIATDSEIIKKHCENFGANTLLTSKDCLTGTDRIAEVSEKIPSSQYINLQGDEPIFPSDQLEIFIRNVIADKTKVYTAITSIKNEKDYRNYSIPKWYFRIQKDYFIQAELQFQEIKRTFLKKLINIYAFMPLIKNI